MHSCLSTGVREVVRAVVNAAQLGRAMTRRTSKEVKSCFDNIPRKETGKHVSKEVEHTTLSVAIEGIQT